MANGRAAALEPHERLAGEAALAIGEIVGRAASARILTAAPLAREDIEAVAGEAIETRDELTFDRAAASSRARRRRRLGALVLSEQSPSCARRPGERRNSRPRRSCARDRPSSLEQSAKTMARPGDVLAPPPSRANGLIFPTRRSKPRPTGSRPICWARRVLAEIAADDLSQALRASLPARKRAASTRKLPPTSSPRPAPQRPLTTKAREARASRCACKNFMGSPNTRRWRAVAYP